MKVFAAISTTALLLFLGTAVPAFAQDEHQDQGAKPAQHEQQAKPAQHQEQAQPARQDTQAKPDRQQAQQPSSAKQESRPEPAQQQQQAKPARQENQAKPAQHQEQAKSTRPSTHATTQAKPVRQQASGNSGGQQHIQRTAADQQRQRSQPALRLSARSSSRIPDDRFRSNFGRGHEFRIGSPRWLADIRAFNTAATGLDSYSRGRKVGTTRMTSTSITSMADIICATRHIPELRSLSASYCN